MRRYGLNDALNAYWSATNHREMQAAHHEILLFGGKDGYPASAARWQRYVARKLRQLALWVERF